jgi:glycine/D-amino acid oxidase-like deaminating enzyme
VDGPVVVIGGGILGCSAAWHLLNDGVRDVTLVDAGQVGSGTSSAGAGFVALWAAGFLREAGRPELEMERYGLDFYRRLHETSSGGIGYKNNGNLSLVLTESGWERAERQLEHPDAPLGTCRLTPLEITDLTGAVRADAVAGGVWQPAGIQMEADLALRALAQAIEQMGGRLLTNTHAYEIRVRKDRVDGVMTDHCVLPADSVVLAAGAWSASLLAALGQRLPMVRVIATRIITAASSVPPTMPTIQCAELGLWIRERFGGYTWGTGLAYRPAHLFEANGHEIRPGRPRVPELLDRTRDIEPQLARVFSGFATSRIVEWMQGIPCFTPDLRHYIGRSPSLPNLIVIAGDREVGVSHGPAMGRAAAQLVLDRETFVDLAAFRIDRFAEANVDESAALDEVLFRMR